MDGITYSMEMSLSKLWEIVKEGQGSLACCSPWGCKELDMTEQLNKESSERHDNGDLVHLDLESWSKLSWHQSCRCERA